MAIDTKTVTEMANAGIAFVASVTVPGGGQTVSVPSNSVPEYVADPQGFAAKLFGVTKEQYLLWVEMDGMPQCGATTKNSSRCKNGISGGSQRSIEEWLRLDGDYCAVHGGEGANIR
ncbi:hypothetical protein [Rhizobium ruizarguesonis]|uniref:hypothetical protein n=1 Tax=Rhizobium ruizarguesonis TaxID=2081791 RepID=UPI001030844E|nr:hypothetical protein [Rhizobium ruizarguesonis]TAV04526.1 hypothetical protein ELI39_04080 [Rhizobium ruizarguesonis]